LALGRVKCVIGAEIGKEAKRTGDESPFSLFRLRGASKAKEASCGGWDSILPMSNEDAEESYPPATSWLWKSGTLSLC